MQTNNLPKKILIVEDEQDIARTLQLNLELEGYSTQIASSIHSADQLLKKHAFDLIILDILFPESSGLELAGRLLLQQENRKILFMSAQHNHQNKIKSLQIGHDFLYKPFALDEFLLRVNNLLQEDHKIKLPDSITFGGNKIFLHTGNYINFEQQEGQLNKRMLALMRLFFMRRNQVLSRKEILEKVWGYNTAPATRTIDNHLLFLRKTFEKQREIPEFFIAIRGEGYLFKYH